MKLAFLFVLVLGPLFSAFGQTQTSEQRAVESAVIGIFEGFSAQDAAKIQSHCTTDYKILEHGVVWNGDSVTNVLTRHKSGDFKRVNTLDFIETVVRGNTAWTAYRNRADISLNGRQRTVNWLESAFLVKESNGWKVALLHSTVVSPGRK